MLRYRLRTLLIVLAIAPLVWAGAYWWYKSVSVREFRGAGQTLTLRISRSSLPMP